jgi:flagellar biosynthesis component FlhA
MLTHEPSAPPSTPTMPADVAERLLRAVAAWLPGTAWHQHPAAIVVDDPAMRGPLRQLLSLQAPELLVLQAAELPGWVEVRSDGEL